MSDKLKKFVTNTKQEFDSHEPAGDLWKKIDAKMEIKDPSNISSKWLSKFRYLAFGSSVLIVAVYFIARNLNDPSSHKLASNRKDSANNSERFFYANQYRPELNSTGNHSKKEMNSLENKKNENSGSSFSIEQNKLSSEDTSMNSTKDIPDLSSQENGTNSEKENNFTENIKNSALYIPEEPAKSNTFTGTLYKGDLFCSVVRAFKFPGKVNIYTGQTRNAKNHRAVMRTTSCSRLSEDKSLKAVWLKGKTDKEIKIAVKEGFTNMFLLKSDGRKINPEAISHYYPGVGVIMEYKGKYFNMMFKDKLELILFFKDAEDGDKIILDGKVEAVIKDQP